MTVSKQIATITYDVKIEFNKTDKEILGKALAMLKDINATLDCSFNDHSVASLVIEKDVNDLILEMDKYTDYICKR